MPIYWTQVRYLRPDSRLFAADRCNMRRTAASRTSLNAWTNSPIATGSVSVQTPDGAQFLLSQPPGCEPLRACAGAAYGSIRRQNHRVESYPYRLPGAEEFLMDERPVDLA